VALSHSFPAKFADSARDCIANLADDRPDAQDPAVNAEFLRNFFASRARLVRWMRRCSVMPQLQKPLARRCAISYQLAAEKRNFITLSATPERTT
jgi:hypothetical protein